MTLELKHVHFILLHDFYCRRCESHQKLHDDDVCDDRLVTLLWTFRTTVQYLYCQKAELSANETTESGSPDQSEGSGIIAKVGMLGGFRHSSW